MDLRESITNQTDVSCIIVNMFSPERLEVIPTWCCLLSQFKSFLASLLLVLRDQLRISCFVSSSPIPLMSLTFFILISSTPSSMMSSQMKVHVCLSLMVFGSTTHFLSSLLSSRLWLMFTKLLQSLLIFRTSKPAEVANQVNQWAKIKTNDLIKEILPHEVVNNMTRLIFVNALYFKGTWSDKFNASESKDHKFHLLNGGSIRAPFMTSTNKKCIAVFDGFKMLKLRYKQGTDTRCFSMYFILPDAHDGLPALVDKISSESGFLTHHLPSRKVSVGKFLIPKFKITFGFEASNVLKELGLTLPFCGDGLTEMVDSHSPEKLTVSQVFHKSIIEVNEEGTEAAATTGFSGILVSYSIEKPIDFVADHPFLFLIKDESTGAVLFIGSLMNPLAG